MFCALLRHLGIPSRTRCGFGKYFLPNSFEDYWVCEYWDLQQQRWILVDAQLDDIQQKALKISFDPLDVPRVQFLVAGQAWRMCHKEHVNPESFGIFDLHGVVRPTWSPKRTIPIHSESCLHAQELRVVFALSEIQKSVSLLKMETTIASWGLTRKLSTNRLRPLTIQGDV